MMPVWSRKLCGLLRSLGAAAIVVVIAGPAKVLAEPASIEPIIDYSTRHHAVVDSRGMVAVQNAIAAEVGAEVLAEVGMPSTRLSPLDWL